MLWRSMTRVRIPSRKSCGSASRVRIDHAHDECARRSRISGRAPGMGGLMSQLLMELLPFAVFVGIGIFAVTEPRSARTLKKTPRVQRFCGYLEDESVMMVDPDGTPVPRSLEGISRFSIGR